MPEKRSNKVSSISSVDTHTPSTSTPEAKRECSMAALVEICGGKVGVYSPMIAIVRFTLPLQLIIEYNYAGGASPASHQTAKPWSGTTGDFSCKAAWIPGFLDWACLPPSNNDFEANGVRRIVRHSMLYCS
jgi:hypothetical protein